MTTTDGAIHRCAARYALLALVGCTPVRTSVSPDRAGRHWYPHTVRAERVESTRLDGLETEARREAEDYCAGLGMAVEEFTTRLARAEAEHTIHAFTPWKMIRVPAKAFVHASFRCMPVDRTLRLSAETPRCASGPTGALTWASMTPYGISALFADGTRLELYAIEDTPGWHPLHPLDGAIVHTAGLDLDSSFSALSGSYTLHGGTLRLEHVRLLHTSYGERPPCWTEVERLEVPLARPEWLESRKPRCEEPLLVEHPGLERWPVTLDRVDQPGAWTDALHGPTLQTPSFAKLQLRVELGVPPRSGRHPVGGSLAVELVANGRRLHGVSGFLRLDIQRNGSLSGYFEDLWVLSDEAEPCAENVTPPLRWRAGPPVETDAGEGPP